MYMYLVFKLGDLIPPINIKIKDFFAIPSTLVFYMQFFIAQTKVKMQI